MTFGRQVSMFLRKQLCNFQGSYLTYSEHGKKYLMVQYYYIRKPMKSSLLGLLDPEDGGYNP
jgi:hypothetical protein